MDVVDAAGALTYRLGDMGAWGAITDIVSRNGGPVQLIQRGSKWFLVGITVLTAKKFFDKTGDAFFEPFFERWLNWVKKWSRRMACALHLAKPNAPIGQHG